MKLLFSSVGRRVELMQAFRQAAREEHCILELHGADMSESAPALFFCDKKHGVPRISSTDYIPSLLHICEQEKIDALIPTIDTDLLLLAQNKEKFMAVGTTVVISAPEKIAICRDKRLTYEFFRSCGLDAPKTYDDVSSYPGMFPAFIKPKDGSSSINAYKVNNAEELEEYVRHVADYIIQPFIEGVEYTVDIFCDWEGSPIYITPRIRLAVRSGEVLKTQIAHDEKIEQEVMALLAKYHACGPLTVQLIREKKTGIDHYIEINPRFGGGAPLSMKSGANSARAMIRILKGEPLKYMPHAAADGSVYSRFDQSVRVQ